MTTLLSWVAYFWAWWVSPLKYMGEARRAAWGAASAAYGQEVVKERISEVVGLALLCEAIRSEAAMMGSRQTTLWQRLMVSHKVHRGVLCLGEAKWAPARIERKVRQLHAEAGLEFQKDES